MFKWFWEATFSMPGSDTGFVVSSQVGFDDQIRAYRHLQQCCDDGTMTASGVPEGAQSKEIVLVFKKDIPNQ